MKTYKADGTIENDNSFVDTNGLDAFTSDKIALEEVFESDCNYCNHTRSYYRIEGTEGINNNDEGGFKICNNCMKKIADKILL